MDKLQYQQLTKRLNTRSWDPVEYLKTPADRIAYLDAAFEDGDPHLVAACLGDIAKSEGMTAIAAETGLGRESLYKSLSQEGNPRLATVLSVLRALGFRLRPSIMNLEETENYNT